MPKIIVPDSFEHWLELKSEDVSSTEVSALFGISPYSTEFELWHQKNNGGIHTIEDNERMYCGRTIEDTIAKMASEKLGIKVRRLKTYMRHDTCDRMGSSFDYEIVSHERGPGILEIKNVDGLVYRKEWSEEEAPAHIEAQVQHQLEITNREWCIIAALVGGNQLKFIYRDRNKKVGEAICNRITDFWASIENQIEPEPDFSRDADFINSMYDDSGEALDITDNTNLQALIISYRELKARSLDLDKACKAIKAEVMYDVGSASSLFCSDFKVNMNKTKDTAPTLITDDMVGDEIGGREGYRQFRITNVRKK